MLFRNVFRNGFCTACAMTFCVMLIVMAAASSTAQAQAWAPDRPGQVWVQGHWQWDEKAGEYYWVRGRWVRDTRGRPKAGFVFRNGGWTFEGR